jgi:hypothetical protein
MKRRIRLTESDLYRIIKESVKKVLRENKNYKTINEISTKTIMNASDVAFSKNKAKQGFRFDDEVRRRIISALANDSYFWYIDFDENSWDLPDNWDEMNQYERAEYVYDKSEYWDEDWISYLELD